MWISFSVISQKAGGYETHSMGDVLDVWTTVLST